MKRLFIILLLLFCLPANAGVIMMGGAGTITEAAAGPIACSSYTGVSCEDFNNPSANYCVGTSGDNNCYVTYTSTGGTPDFTASGSTYGMSGTYCLAVEQYMIYHQTVFTEKNTLYFLVQARIDAASADDDQNFFQIYDANGDAAVGLRFTTSGGYGVISVGGTVAKSANSKISVDTTYWFRGKYTKGTGTNAESKISLWNGSSWEDYIVSSDGTSTSGARGYAFRNYYSNTPTIIHYGIIKFSESEFSNAPTTY